MPFVRTPEYSSWANMKTRCYNPNDAHYQRWGGKGIKVCDRWHSFENFLADMGPKPTLKHSLDRIDNSLGYSPENCRWATHREQLDNRTVKSKTSKYTGVCKCSKSGKWRAYTKHNKKNIHIGLFDTEELARDAYLKTRLKLDGTHNNGSLPLGTRTESSESSTTDNSSRE